MNAIARLSLPAFLLAVGGLAPAFLADDPIQDQSERPGHELSNPDVTTTPAAAPGPLDQERRYGPARVDIGLNMSALAYGGGKDSGSELPFTNMMKVCKTFDAVLAGDSYPTGGSVVDYEQVFTDIDDDGYARETIPFLGYVIGTHIAHGIAGKYPTGSYVVSFDGAGTLSFSGDVTSVTVANPNRYEISVAATNRGIIMRILTSAGAPDYVRNIRVVPSSLVDPNGDPMQTFLPAFLDRLDGLGPKALRFQNWKAVLAKTQPLLADEAETTHYTYDRFAGRGGPPHEVCRELAAEVGAGMWINIPYDADLAGYVQQLAIDVADWSLASGCTAYVEYGSEVWNPLFGNQFCWVVDTQTGCTTSCDPTNPPSLDPALEACIAQYLADHSKAIFDYFEPEFALRGIENQLVRVIGSRINSASYTTMILNNLGGADQVDYIALNTYFGQRSVKDLGWASMQAIGPELYEDYLHAVIEGGPYANLKTFLVAQRAAVDAHNLSFAPPDDVRLAAYEGGQSMLFDVCDCPGFCPAKTDPVCLAQETFLTGFFHGMNRSDHMFQLYYHLLNMWEEMTAPPGEPGGLWMHFVFTQEFLPAGSGSWGLLEYYDSDPAAAPKYQAVQACQAW